MGRSWWPESEPEGRQPPEAQQGDAVTLPPEVVAAAGATPPWPTVPAGLWLVVTAELGAESCDPGSVEARVEAWLARLDAGERAVLVLPPGYALSVVRPGDLGG